MDAHFDGRLRHARERRGLGHGEPLQLDVNDRQPVTVRQLFEQLADVAFGIGGFFVRGREDLERVVQRIVNASRRDLARKKSISL